MTDGGKTDTTTDATADGIASVIVILFRWSIGLSEVCLDNEKRRITRAGDALIFELTHK